jgi:ribosomal protein S18 acetylase RimI-like enzyme
MTPIIKTATDVDEAAAVAVLVLAFSADPAARWAWPDPGEYLRQFPEFVKVFGGRAFANRSAHVVDGHAAAALWLPPGVTPDDEALTAFIQRTGSAQVQRHGPAVFEQMARYHPQEPHWFLPFIGVDPQWQRQGHGSLLMQHALAQCDRDRMPAYLESSNPRNIPLYERHGFQVLGTIQVGTSPPIVPMLRSPR